TLVWEETDSPAEKVGKVLARYLPHFGLDFLFLRSSDYVVIALPRGSLFHWYDLPLLIAGLITLLANLKRSPASRVLLAWIICYPAADLLNKFNMPHVLKSLPGVCGLVLLSAVGAVQLGRRLWQWHRAAAWVAGAALVVVALWMNVRFLSYFYTDFNREPE